LCPASQPVPRPRTSGRTAGRRKVLEDADPLVYALVEEPVVADGAAGVGVRQLVGERCHSQEASAHLRQPVLARPREGTCGFAAASGATWSLRGSGRTRARVSGAQRSSQQHPDKCGREMVTTPSANEPRNFPNLFFAVLGLTHPLSRGQSSRQLAMEPSDRRPGGAFRTPDAARHRPPTSPR
jgi:hypothetical protein